MHLNKTWSIKQGGDINIDIDRNKKEKIKKQK